MVFQNYALYPHMTVAENIGFRCACASAEARGAQADRGDRPRHRPSTTSTASRGSFRRPAPARRDGRAIVRGPQVFLMDEPLSNLDAKLRVQIRAEILRIQRQLRVTTVYVTHDQVEAMTMGTASPCCGVACCSSSRSRSASTRSRRTLRRELIGSPAMNMLEATVERDGDASVLSSRLVGAADPARRRDRSSAGTSASASRSASVRRRSGRWTVGGDDGRGRLRGVVRAVEALGPEQLAYVEVEASSVLVEDVVEGLVEMEEATDLVEIKQEGDGGRGALVVARLDAASRVRPDEPLELSVDPRRLHFFDLDSGSAIGTSFMAVMRWALNETGAN